MFWTPTGACWRVSEFLFVFFIFFLSSTGIINAASVALADAGIEMKDVMTAVSVGVTPNGPAVDLTAKDEQGGEYSLFLLSI